jgi:hypothetical protein
MFERINEMTTETYEKPANEPIPETPVAQAPVSTQYPSQQPYYYSYWQQYQPYRRSPNTALQVGFWIFYLLVGFWIDFSLTLSLWVCAVVLPFTLPLALLVRNNTDASLWTWDDGVRIYQMTDTQFYTAASIVTGVGIMLLVFALLTLKPWLHLHRFIFRELGGLNI